MSIITLPFKKMTFVHSQTKSMVIRNIRYDWDFFNSNNVVSNYHSFSVFFFPVKIKSARENHFWRFFGFFHGWKCLFTHTYFSFFHAHFVFSRGLILYFFTDRIFRFTGRILIFFHGLLFFFSRVLFSLSKFIKIITSINTYSA